MPNLASCKTAGNVENFALKTASSEWATSKPSNLENSWFVPIKSHAINNSCNLATLMRTRHIKLTCETSWGSSCSEKEEVIMQRKGCFETLSPHTARVSFYWLRCGLSPYLFPQTWAAVKMLQLLQERTPNKLRLRTSLRTLIALKSLRGLTEVFQSNWKAIIWQSSIKTKKREEAGENKT